MGKFTFGLFIGKIAIPISIKYCSTRVVSAGYTDIFMTVPIKIGNDHIIGIRLGKIRIDLVEDLSPIIQQYLNTVCFIVGHSQVNESILIKITGSHTLGLTKRMARFAYYHIATRTEGTISNSRQQCNTSVKGIGSNQIQMTVAVIINSNHIPNTVSSRISGTKTESTRAISKINIYHIPEIRGNSQIRVSIFIKIPGSGSLKTVPGPVIRPVIGIRQYISFREGQHKGRRKSLIPSC